MVGITLAETWYPSRNNCHHILENLADLSWEGSRLSDVTANALAGTVPGTMIDDMVHHVMHAQFQAHQVNI